MTLPELKNEIATLITKAKKSGLLVEVATYSDNADKFLTKVETVTVENLFGEHPLIVINPDPEFKK